MIGNFYEPSAPIRLVWLKGIYILLCVMYIKKIFNQLAMINYIIDIELDEELQMIGISE